MRAIFANYLKLERPIVFIIIAELFIQIINTSFFMILNIYMTKQGYADHQIADFISFQFLGVLCFAFPMGLFIKGRRILPMFYVAGVGVPVVSLIIVHAVEYHWDAILYPCFSLWGIFFACLQISIMPFLIRNASEDTQSEAISLHFTVNSFGTIATGITVFLLSLNQDIANENFLLKLFAFAGFVSLYFIYKVRIIENVPKLEVHRLDLKQFDWPIIFQALVPTLIIAIGAGLTIPFLNLFFYHIHHMDSPIYSFMNCTTAILVSLCSMAVPQIKRRYGYKIAITVSQSIAIFMLVILATTQFYSNAFYALNIATLCFMLRQPLMNMAGPMTSQLVMKYVGERNQEIVSALTSGIWSASWYFSSRIFKMLRENGFDYANIFFVTAVIYSIGVIWYYLLILDFNRREKMGLIQTPN